MQKLTWVNANGNEIDLTKDPFGITEWEGFSNVDLNVQSQEVPFHDGAVYLDGLISQRDLSVTLAINDDKDLEKRYRLRRQLIASLNPKLGEGYLIYENDFISKRIKCVAQTPIFPTHNSDNPGTPKASLSWTACDPYWEDLEETTVEFKYGEFPIIENEGDIPCQLKINLIGSVTNPQIKNLTTNKKIKYNGEMQKPIYIDTNFGQKKVVSEDVVFKTNKVNESYLAVKYYNEKFYAVGKNGILKVSSDGINWDFINTRFNNDLNDIVYSSELNLFVAVGNSGTILTSSDGIEWTKRTFVTGSYNIKGIVYSNELNLFVAVSSHTTLTSSFAGCIATSSDGITWTKQAESVFENGRHMFAITYSSELNLFVAVGIATNSNYSNVMTSSDGITWTRDSTGTERNLLAVTYSSELNLFVATNEYGRICTSSDGATWTSINTSTNRQLRSVIYSSELNLFVIVGYNGTIITSSDGESWEVINQEITNNLCGIIYSSELNLFVIVGYNIISVTPDIINQTFIFSDEVPSFRKIAYSSELNLFVAVGNNSTILTSSDGITWTSRSSGTNTLYGITYSSELHLFVAVGHAGSIATSSDGINWTSRSLDTGYHFYGVTYSSELHLFVAVGTSGYFLTSSDGVEWTLNYMGLYFEGRSIAYSSELNLFVAVGYRGSTTYTHGMISSDGINWTSMSMGTDLSFESVIYSSQFNLFIAVGESGGIFISSNGTSWVSKSTGTNGLCDVTYSSELNLFVAVGIFGTILTSSNGNDWIQANLNVPNALNGIVYSPNSNKFVIVGTNIVVGSELSLAQNKIENISKDSDMNLNLQIGKNQFILSRSSGKVLMVELTYRQKYIGV